MGRRRWTVREKIALLRAAELGDRPVSAICREAGVSRDTLYRWRRAHASRGRAGLRAARPSTLDALRIDDDLVCAVIDITQAHPEWGKARVARELPREDDGYVSPTGVRLIWTDVDGRSVTTRRAREAWAAWRRTIDQSPEERRREKRRRELVEGADERWRRHLQRLQPRAPQAPLRRRPTSRRRPGKIPRRARAVRFRG
jgi:transposase-like protein